MSDFFRIHRGLEIDTKVRIIPASGLPGSTSDTDTASVGSIYTDINSGTVYSKVAAGSGFVTWNPIAATGIVLYRENVVSPGLNAPMGANSITLGQAAQTALTAHDSVAIGNQSLARHPGIVQASGRFGSSGDAQAGRYLLRTVTTNAITTEAFFDGTSGTERLTLPDDSTWMFTATITGHRQDASDGHAGYKIEGVIYRAGGAPTTAVVGAVNKNVLGSSNPAWDVHISADNTYGSLKVNVKGEIGKIIRWVALIETLEITN